MGKIEIIQNKKVRRGGSRKGCINKITLNLLEELKQNNVAPASMLCDILFEDDTTTDQRIVILKELSRYCYPQRKSVEHTGHVNNTTMTLTLKDLKENAQELHDILSGGHVND